MRGYNNSKGNFNVQILNAYSLFDVKALTYSPPFYLGQDAAARRAFEELVNDANTLPGRHPTDFILYCVGTFNDTTGLLEPIDPRRHVVDGAALIKLPPAPLFDMPKSEADPRFAGTTGTNGASR